MTAAPKPLPCPWCRRINARVAYIGLTLRLSVHCHCGARGRGCISDRSAILAWNRVARLARRKERKP